MDSSNNSENLGNRTKRNKISDLNITHSSTIEHRTEMVNNFMKNPTKGSALRLYTEIKCSIMADIGQEMSKSNTDMDYEFLDA